MTAIGNFFRFILFGWWQWLIYMFFAFIFGLTVVFLPLAKSFREMAKLILKPYGKRIVKDKELLGKYENGFGLFFNIIWFPIGLVFFLFYFIKGFFEMITIVGIPFAIVDFKIGKAMFLPIGIRVLNEDQYMSYKVSKEIKNNGDLYKNKVLKNKKELNKTGINQQNNINNIDIDANKKIELSPEEKIELEELKKKAVIEEEKRKIELENREKELELLRKKDEIERLKRKEEFRKKLNDADKRFKKNLKKIYKKGKEIVNKYLPEILAKGKEFENKIIKNVKDIKKEDIKNLGLNKNIKKIQILKLEKKNRNYLILVILLIFLGFIGNYIYNNFYYNNQIIKIGDKISFKKSIDSIEYFNNNKIKIIPDNLKKPILSQYLMGYREYDGYNYKKAGYSAIYFKKDNNIDIEHLKDNLKGRDIIVDSVESNNTLIIKYNEKIDRINLYDTELFKELNTFTNIDTFYSNISNNIYFVGDSKLISLIYKNFDILNIIDKIDSFVKEEQLKNKLLGLDIKDKKIILRIKYNFYNESKDNFNFLFNSIEELEDEIPEESILIYENSKIENNGNYVDIKIEFTIDKDKINKNIFTNLY